MGEPRRVQLSRRAGWRKPEGAVVVSRPGKWGNPFTLEWVRLGDGVETLTDHEARTMAVQTFEAWLTVDAYASPFPASMHKRRDWMLGNLHTLAGKDLCCWCPLPKDGEVDWCHAAVLMRLAAKVTGGPRV